MSQALDLENLGVPATVFRLLTAVGTHPASTATTVSGLGEVAIPASVLSPTQSWQVVPRGSNNP